MVNQQPALYMDLLIMAPNHDNDLPNWNMEDIKIFAYLKWNRFIYSRAQELFYKLFSKITNKLVK